jgi:HEAT repeat protein
MKTLYTFVLPLILLLSIQTFASEPVAEFPYIPGDVKVQVDKTFAVNANERAEAAYKLGKMGEGAYRSVPLLMRMLDDNLPVWCRYNDYGGWTTPGKEAAKALAKIGKPSLNYILPLLEKKHPYVFMNEYMERNVASALYGITGQGFGSDFPKWTEWLKTQ